MASSIDISDLLAKLEETELGNNMLTALKLLKKVPSIDVSKLLQDETLGEYDKSTNSISLNSGQDLTGWGDISSRLKSPTTLAHELWHATEEAIGNELHSKGSKFPEKYKKEIDKFSSSAGDIATDKLLEASGADYYRRSWPEKNAFGVGNSLAPKLGNALPSRPGPSHVDATLATEAAIKLDLFLRGFKSTQKDN